MDKTYNHKLHEDKIYELWERSGAFTPKIDPKKKPFTIILPLPNANNPMHMGHALFTVEDIMIRYHRMLGDPTLWLPGGDHAGIETQFVFEKHLAKEGKSRFDYDRNTLYKMIKNFADENRDLNKNQMKKLGFSLDWSRYHYSLEPGIIEKVFATFRQLYKDAFIYRANRMVNYCTKCGTAFSDLEINHEEKDDFLYYLDYGKISIATTRPETIFADVAIAVNPKDKKYKDQVGKSAIIPLINRSIPIIADSAIKTDFGSGALKVTPAHDPADYEIGLRHNLEVIESIDKNGRMINVPEKYLGMKIAAARKTVIADLKANSKLIKIEPLTHTVNVCYRCHTTIEPMLLPQWYVKTKPLAKPAIAAVKNGKTKIVPKKRFEKMYFDWLNTIQDWNISRQIVWGPRIPAWYCLDCNNAISVNFINKKGEKHSGLFKDLIKSHSFEEIRDGLQNLSAPVDARYSIEKLERCKKCGSTRILQETDTFDTWFLSAQWPMNTLGFPDSPDFKYFYPTSVLDTLWDILFFWVARMMMLGLYRTGDAPFRVVHLHARVVDKFGKKMSKSKGNVINPLEMLEKYGADALRMALTYGVSPASDVIMTDEKVRSMRNFANKVWNISRFVLANKSTAQNSRLKSQNHNLKLKTTNTADRQIVSRLNRTIKDVTKHLNTYRFDFAIEELYQFIWHEFADVYLESTKNRREEAQPVLTYVLENSLKLLHPFMPFVTEAIWDELIDLQEKPDELLITSTWPK
jgi:valyl-tRNA synthetase